jgi:CRISPR/Cas system CSM-associated protein Csm3 (group 7 of RAMP superfamily)
MREVGAVQAKIEWEVASAICIGSTADTRGIGVDKATARGADGILIIPGSTLKGRIRWECERIARALGWEVCDAPQPDNMCPYFWVSRREPSEDYFCVLCQIFGSTAKRSAVWFTDATLKKDERLQTVIQGKTSAAELRPFDAQIRPGVSLSRARRTALNERLFLPRLVPPTPAYVLKPPSRGAYHRIGTVPYCWQECVSSRKLVGGAHVVWAGYVFFGARSMAVN